MCDAFVGEIRMFGGPYAPDGWLLCDGTLLPINGYEMLFALIGATYGGNGTTNFALPDLQGRLPIGLGQGPGLANRILGQTGGSEVVTLTAAQMPSHTHEAKATSAEGTQGNPEDGLWATTMDETTSPPTPVNQYILASEIKTTDKKGDMDPLAIEASGGSHPHNNVMPVMPLNFIICIRGTYPEFP